MKLLYVHNSNFLQKGANKIQVINMCNAFKKINLKITLLSFNCSKKIIKKKFGINVNFKTISLKPRGNYYFRSLKLFFYFLKIRKNYDVIYSRDLIFSFLTSFFLRKKIIYELHDLSIGKLWFFLFRITFKRLYYCFVISQGLKEELIKNNFDSNRIFVLSDGVDLFRFDVGVSGFVARKSLGLPLGKKIVSYIGSLQDWKGYRTFLDSFFYLKNKDDIVFLVVGGSEEEIIKLRDVYKDDNFIFIPFVDYSKIPFFLKASDILVIPNSGRFDISVNYTSPLKLFEYMASKRPIIASDLPSIREVVGDDDVLFFKPDDENDLARKIDSLLNNNYLKRKFANNAYKKVSYYTWEERAKKIKNIIYEDYL